MAKVDAHMRHPRANQQGAGISYRQTASRMAAENMSLGTKGNPFTLEDLEKLLLADFDHLGDTLPGNRVYFTYNGEQYYFSGREGCAGSLTGDPGTQTFKIGTAILVGGDGNCVILIRN